MGGVHAGAFVEPFGFYADRFLFFCASAKVDKGQGNGVAHASVVQYLYILAQVFLFQVRYQPV